MSQTAVFSLHVIILCFLFPLILQSSSQQILIGFVDYLEINEPEEPRDKDDEGKQECTCHEYCLFYS